MNNVLRTRVAWRVNARQPMPKANTQRVPGGLTAPPSGYPGGLRRSVAAASAAKRNVSGLFRKAPTAAKRNIS